MAKDYAQRNSTHNPRKRPAKPARSGMPSWLWAFIGLTAGLCIAAGVYIVKTPVANEAAPQSRPTAEPAPAKAQSGPDLPPRQEARFKFYDMLPKSEVKASEEPYRQEAESSSSSSSAPAATPNPDARYLIQAGSFRATEDAERRKANLALLGIESEVRQVEVDGRGTYFRVQIGPAMDYRQAEKTMRQLADNNIDSFATRSDG